MTRLTSSLRVVRVGGSVLAFQVADLLCIRATDQSLERTWNS